EINKIAKVSDMRRPLTWECHYSLKNIIKISAHSLHISTQERQQHERDGDPRLLPNCRLQCNQWHSVYAKNITGECK
ncbi:hypothetical protein CU098_008534, partial [Rhizopus stolonifer]